jgi:hypothetical protein
MAIYPQLRSMPGMKYAEGRIEALSNSTSKDRALSVTAQQVIILAGDLSNNCQKCALQLWLSAARHCDSLAWQPHYYGRRKIVGLFFQAMKGDAKGKRQFCKWLPCGDQMAQALWTAPAVSYAEFMRFLRASPFPHLTAHSFRNGAIEFLERAYAKHEVAMLSGHAIKHDTVPGITPYWSPDPNSPAAKQCLLVAGSLMTAVGLSKPM